LQKEKVRVYSLARELNIESKDLLDICKQAGIDVKNQLSSLDPDLAEQIKVLVRKGGAGPTAAPLSARSSTPVIPTLPTPVPTLSSRTSKREPESVRTPASPKTQELLSQPGSGVPGEKPPAVLPPISPAAKHTEPPQPKIPELGAVRTSESKPSSLPESGSRATSESSGKGAAVGSSKMRDLNQLRPEGVRPQRKREIPRPPVRVAPPPPLKKPMPKEVKKPQEPAAQKPIARLPEVLKSGPINIQDILNKSVGGAESVSIADIEEDEETPKEGKSRPGGVAGRDKRHQQRNLRAKARKEGELERASTRMLLTADEDRPQRIKQRLKDSQKRKAGPTQPRKGKVPVSLPISVRSLSEAIGIRSTDVLANLLQHGLANTNINSSLDPVIAETVALEFGCELDIKKQVDAEGALFASLQQPENPLDLVPRAPIVTVMGHVDHGKTSLLDKIRRSNVVATETGGITQVLRAWRVDHGGHPVTFLDTPGHEAFTKMRARGAQVTDIAVVVVAADDGVMPQTEEAINHARAAGVPIVIAINKVDLPSANITKTRQQLYSLQVLPDNMGGDVPFVETSAATGKGVDELLDTLSLVAETLLELKANPKKRGSGTCLEAMLTEGEGVRATLVVQDGTLRKGDVILCGASYGRVRAMYDDMGRPIQEAGPSVPVQITGLNEVPNADDPFQGVPDLAIAREIAEKRKTKYLESTLFKREPARLESLTEQKIAELKVILKADFRGSIEAIRKEMEKLVHAEVRVRILHAAIGGITESDVQLALTSPQDTIIVGFNVVPDDRALALAEEKEVQIRQYDIIYHLTDDIRAALEGKLKPREEVVHLGRAVVRDTFRISRKGTIAGCYVTQGVIERSAKVRLIREGVVIYPPSDRTAGLESLRRFKEDVREVHQDFECGLKIAGYDDVKVGDVIEAYRVEQVHRTLQEDK